MDLFLRPVTAARGIATLALLLLAGCPNDVGRLDVADTGRPDTTVMDAPSTEDTAPRCVRDEDCSDNTYCNGAERCVGGTCVPGLDPCDDSRTCTRDLCDEAMDRCTREYDHSMCGDTDACNGVERCEPTALGASGTTGCTPVRPENVIDCDDSNTCTLDACDGTLGCIHAPRDLDGDGHVDRSCTIDGTPFGPPGDDCNDGDAATFPGAPERCDDSRDNNCNGQVDYAEAGACVPVNETCGDATRLPGDGMYWGSTAGLRNDLALSCNPGTAPDAFFVFTLTEAHDVTITTSTTGTAAGVALLGDCAAMTEIRCGRGASSVAPQVRVRSLQAGTYYIAVETGATGTAFRLTLRIEPPTTALREDTCPAADGMPVELNDGMPHTVSLAALEDDYALSCRTTTTGRDAIFRLTLNEESDVNLRGTSPTGSVYLSFRNDPCAAASGERRCFSGSGTTGATLTQRGLAAGTYWVIAENSSTTDPNVTVTATVASAAMRAIGDTCPGAVVVPDGVPTTINRATLLPSSDVGTSCGTSTGTGSTYTDAVYSFTLTETRDVVINTLRTGTGTIYMQPFSACGVRMSNLGPCVSGSTTLPSRRIAGLGPGTYYVVVESLTTAAVADTSVQVVTSDPALRPAVEACPGQSVPTDGTTQMVTWGTTGTAGALGAGPDLGTSCGSRGTSATYRDAVVSFTIDRVQDVEVTIDSGGTFVYRDVRSTCADSAATVVACHSGSGSTVRRARSLAAGTYYIVMETTTASPVPTRVTVRATDPVPVVNYVMSSPAGVEFVDACALAEHGTVVSSVDDAIAAIPAAPVVLPFPVRMYNLNATPPFTVSSNGWLALAPTTTSGLSGTIPSPTEPNLVIAGYWRDLFTSTPGVCYGVTGTAPNRAFVVQWNRARHLGGTESLDFEIVIREAPTDANNVIDVIYREMTGATTATAGVENEDGSLGTSDVGPFTAPRIVRYTPTL